LHYHCVGLIFIQFLGIKVDWSVILQFYNFSYAIDIELVKHNFFLVGMYYQIGACSC